MPSAVCWPMSSDRRSSTLSTCSRLTLLSPAMAVPTVCTSRALKCFRTSAASSSPRVSNRMAARCGPSIGTCFGSAGIFVHPVLYDLRDLLGILPYHASRRFDPFLIIERRLHCRRGGAKLGRRRLLARLVFGAHADGRHGAGAGQGEFARIAAQQAL